MPISKTCKVCVNFIHGFMDYRKLKRSAQRCTSFGNCMKQGINIQGFVSS